jgi:hypothetical protein
MEQNLVKQCAEFVDRHEWVNLPSKIRGIYALYKYRPKLDKYNLVYLGRATKGGIKGRLKAHDKSQSKADKWTHFSAYEVPLSDKMIEQLEGLIIHLSRKETKAQKLNRQRRNSKIARVRRGSLDEWES